MNEDKVIEVNVLIKEDSSNTLKSIVISEDEGLNKIFFSGESVNDVINNTVSSIKEVYPSSEISVFISTPVVDLINNNILKGVINRMTLIKKKNLDMINSSDCLLDDSTKKILSGSIGIIDKLIEKIR